MTSQLWVDAKVFALIRLLCMSGAQIFVLRAGISSDFHVLDCIREASNMEERLKLSYMDVKLGLPIKEAARKHNVAYTTHQNRMQNPPPNSPGHPTLFMPHEENLFATLVLGYEMFGVPLPPHTFLSMIRKYASDRSKPHEMSNLCRFDMY